MSIQKLHYENLGGMLIRREGLLNWRCPLCKAEGQSPEVMRACPECGSKEAALPGAQSVPSGPEGFALVNAAHFLAVLDREDWRTAKNRAELRAMLAAAPEVKK